MSGSVGCFWMRHWVSLGGGGDERKLGGGGGPSEGGGLRDTSNLPDEHAHIAHIVSSAVQFHTNPHHRIHLHPQPPPPESPKHLTSTPTQPAMRASRVLAWSRKPEFIASRRALITPAQSPSATKTPLILIGGTAQSVHSWPHHLHHLSMDRNVVVMEARGQGPRQPPHPAFDGDFSNCSLTKHCADVRAFVDDLPEDLFLDNDNRFDLAGFSFGGRIGEQATQYIGLV